jgi:hypothetical protein
MKYLEFLHCIGVEPNTTRINVRGTILFGNLLRKGAECGILEACRRCRENNTDTEQEEIVVACITRLPIVSCGRRLRDTGGT